MTETLIPAAAPLHWLKTFGDVLARVVELVPARITGAVVGAGYGDGTVADLVVLVDTPFTMRLRLHLEDENVCNVFVENPASLATAIGGGTSARCVRVLDGGVIVSDDDGTMTRLCERARQALRTARPVSPADRLRAVSEPAELLSELVRRQKEPAVAQLVFSDLLTAVLRARLAAAQSWETESWRAFDACRTVDPVLAAWIAVTARRPFSPELLPAIETRVAAVLTLLSADEDIVGVPQLTFPPLRVAPS